MSETKAGKDPEASAQVLGDGKVRRPPKPGPGVAHLAHSGQGKGPELLPDLVEPEQVPLVFDAAQVVRLNAPALVLGTTELFVFEGEFMGVEDGAAHRLEEFQVRHTSTEPAEGNCRIDLAPVEPNPIIESLGDLFKGGPQGLFK